MPTIRVDPAGFEFEIPGESPILFEAQEAGYEWPTVCGGKGTCRTCFVRVSRDHVHLSPVEQWEAEGIAALGLVPSGDESIRLACQATATNDVTVHRPGVRQRSHE